MSRSKSFRSLNNKANRAELRADSIRKKIQSIRKSGGDKSQIDSLRKQKNAAINQARSYRNTILSKGGKVRDTVKSGGLLDKRGATSWKGGNNTKNVDNNGRPNRGGGGGNNKSVGEEAKEKLNFPGQVFPGSTNVAPGVTKKPGSTVTNTKPQVDPKTGKPVTGDTALLQNNKGDTGIGGSIKDSGFDPTKFGGSGLGMKDYKELTKRGYTDDQIKKYAQESGLRLGGEFRQTLGLNQNQNTSSTSTEPKPENKDGYWDGGDWEYRLADGSVMTGKGWVDSDPDKWEGKLVTGQMQGQFVDGEYKYGKKFNKKDIRIMTEAGKSIDEIKAYMNEKGIKNEKWFDTMFSRINKGSGFDESGENFDYGYRFDYKDIDNMFKAGKDQQFVSDFIRNNESLNDNQWANHWMSRYGMDAAEELTEEEGQYSEFEQGLLDRIDGLEQKLSSFQNETPKTETLASTAPTTGGGQPFLSGWGNTGGGQSWNPMSLYHSMSNTTPGSAAGTTPPTGTNLTETVPQTGQPTGDPNGPQPIQQPTYTAQPYQPMAYQPIGIPGTSQAFNYTNPPSSGYNPSGSGSPLVAPINPFTQTPQPIGQNGLPVYPTMTYGPGSGPIPGQLTPGGVTPGFAFPQAPGMPGTPMTPNGQVYAGGNPAFDEKTGTYKGPAKPNPKAPQAKTPQFAPLNQLGL